MITKLEIVDTAVKIGLGGIVTGVFGYLLARLTHGNELSKEFAKRRRDTLEAIAEQFQSIHSGVVKAVGEAEGAIYLKKEDSSEWKRALPIIACAQDKVMELRPRLLLLGEKHAVSQLDQYHAVLWSARVRYYADTAPTQEKDPRSNISTAERDVYESLSDAYRSPH